LERSTLDASNCSRPKYTVSPSARQAREGAIPEIGASPRARLNLHTGSRGPSRIVATLIGAVAEARAHAKQLGTDKEFRLMLQHVGEMHELMIDALLTNDWLSTELLRDVATSTYSQIEQLATLATMPNGKMQ